MFVRQATCAEPVFVDRRSGLPACECLPACLDTPVHLWLPRPTLLIIIVLLRLSFLENASVLDMPARIGYIATHMHGFSARDMSGPGTVLCHSSPDPALSAWPCSLESHSLPGASRQISVLLGNRFGAEAAQGVRRVPLIRPL